MKLKIFPQVLMVLLISSIFQIQKGFAQTIQVNGQVVDTENNLPLPGVTVSNAATKLVKVTDMEGRYTIEASEGDRLVFTFMGFVEQSIIVGESGVIDVKLQADVKQLNEVVVVGYGTQSRGSITSSIAKLDESVLKNIPMGNIGSALQGTLPGLQVVSRSGQPGSSPSTLLRGGASINSPGGPLVVVDGIIRSYSDISPEDIASVQLLKDAASTAIYGARANNGVLLITTKEGQTGKAKISYKYTGGFNQRRQGYDYFGARDYIFYNRLGNKNSGRSLSQVNSSRGYGLLTDDANLASFDIRRFDGTTSHLLSQGWDTVSDPYGGTIIFKDHGGQIQDLIFRNTRTNDHYLNVTGGNDKGKYYASFDYYDEDGIIVGSEYQRYTGNLKGSYKVKPNVEVSSGVSLSTSSQYGTVGSEINTLYRNMAIWPTFDPWLDSAQTMPNPGNGVTDGNPLYWLGKQQRENEVNRITANASVKWDILPNLYLKGTGNVYLFESLGQYFQKATQTYSNIFASTPSFNTRRPSIANFGRDVQQQYNAIANYSKTFGNYHNVNVMLGGEYYRTKAYDMQVYGTEAPTDDISTVNASTNFNPGDNYSNTSEYRILSAFGRLNYDYDNRYLFTLVFRQDAVSNLAEDNRVGFFPGMSAGWNIHRESFFQNSGFSNIVSTLKPRISYGENGNVAGVGRYEVQGAYGAVGIYDGGAGFLNTDIINTGLRWEQSRTTDVGIDIGFLDNKIALIFDYYNRKTSDLLTNLSLPSYTGFGSLRTNLGTYQNTGYEFSINANILNQPDGLKLDMGINASLVENKILELPFNGNDRNRQGGMQIYDPASGEVVWVGGLQEGGTLGEIHAFKQVSIFRDDAEVAQIAGNRIDMVARISGPNSTFGSGKITPGDVNWMDVDKNDTIDSRDQVYIGNVNPKWTGGFNANLSYKGFSLYTRFDFAFGHTIYNDLLTRTLGNYQGTFNYIELQKQAWSPSNRDTDIPKVYYADQVSAPLGKKNYTRSNNAGANLNSNNSHFYEKGDYFACREITVAYDFSKDLMAKTRFLSDARVYLSGSNLFYITDFSGASPEPPSGGVYRGTYPTPKTFIMGIEVTF